MQTSEQSPRAPGQARITTVVHDLRELVGAHAVALTAIFRDAPPTDPDELGDDPRAAFLTVTGAAAAHLALRPLVRALSRGSESIWQGIRFDHGGNAGKNLIFGRDALRFRAERAESLIDGGPALVLTYDKAPWPWSGLRDELRTVSPGLAMGPTFMRGRLVAWFGVTRS